MSLKRGSVTNFVSYLQQLDAEHDLRTSKLIAGSVNPRRKNKIYSQLDADILESLDKFVASKRQANDDEEYFTCVVNTLDQLSHLLLKLDVKGRTEKDSRIYAVLHLTN
jgi:hypothetical protein